MYAPEKEAPKTPVKEAPKVPENKQPAKEKPVSPTSLSGYVCCLTGDFNFGSKEDVEHYIVARGGVCKSSMTKAVNMLIIGGLGSDRYSFGSYGRKYVEAKERQDKGENMTILTEEEFFKRFT